MNPKTRKSEELRENNVFKIDELNSKILKKLLQDGRVGFGEIARECEVSENKVWKRFRAMEKKGIINGATIQMNFGHFGNAALATLLISIDAQQIDQVMEFIEKITEIRAYRQYNSVYNVRAIATLRDLNELNDVKQIIKRKLPTTGLKTYIWTGVRNIPENLNFTGALKGTNTLNQLKSNKPIRTLIDEIAIDELDRQIVAKLTMGGRASFIKIAKELELSTDTVVNRYHKLREKGSIKVSIQINPNKIGYTSIIDFNIAVAAPDTLPETVVESLTEIPDVIIITKTSGDYDLQLSAMVRDTAQSFAIQDQISRTCGIKKVEASTRKIPERWPSRQQYISTF